MTQQNYDPDAQFLDIIEPQLVEIQIRDDKQVIWINIDGKCAVRICRITALLIEGPRRRPRVG